MSSRTLTADAYLTKEQRCREQAERLSALPSHVIVMYRKMRRAKAKQKSDRISQPYAGLSQEERRAKRRAALIKIRDLWNESQSGANRITGEDGVEYQKRMRAEWD